jgi:hypothetical protein
MDYTSVTDSGVREEFATGSVRDTRIGKGRYDLLSPIALRRLARHTENGAVKYGDRNWEKGQYVSRYLDSAIRHLYCYLGGARDEDHLAAVMWNAMAAIHTEEKCRAGELPVHRHAARLGRLQGREAGNVYRSDAGHSSHGTGNGNRRCVRRREDGEGYQGHDDQMRAKAQATNRRFALAMGW